MHFLKTCCFWITLFCTPAILFGSPLQMAIPAGEIQVDGATPGGNVVLMGIALQSDGWWSKTDTVTYQVRDLELDGAVSFSLNDPANFDLDESAVHRALWIAVDLSSGESIAFSPESNEVIESSAAFQTARNSGQWQVQFGTESFEAMLVRPGVGAWAGSFSDGAPGDLGPSSDGKVTFSSSSLTSVPVYGSSFSNISVLNGFARGDIFFFIDSTTLQYQIVTNGQK